MRIGFAADGKFDADELAGHGCDRIYSRTDGIVVFRQLSRLLRADDIVVVTGLARLGNEPADCISAVAQLHAAGVGLHVIGTEIEPGTEFGKSFLRACAMIANQLRIGEQIDRQTAGPRVRGRPPVINAPLKEQIELLLQDENISVAQISKLLKISLATIYRHFPRGSVHPAVQKNIEHYESELAKAKDEATREALAPKLPEEEAKPGLPSSASRHEK